MTSDNPIFVPADYFRELRLEELFPDATRPFEVDLGCGDGSFLEELALLHPGRNFLGVERLNGRIEKTARRIRSRRLENARVLRLEAGYTLAWLLPPGCVARLHLLFPDPWPKKAHRKNRIVNNPEFLHGLERSLAPGGEFLLKTDDADFFANALEVMTLRPSFRRLEWPDSLPYPRTAFEQHWSGRGRTIHQARWTTPP